MTGCSLVGYFHSECTICTSHLRGAGCHVLQAAVDESAEHLLRRLRDGNVRLPLLTDVAHEVCPRLG